jgi:hypothetical protein
MSPNETLFLESTSKIVKNGSYFWQSKLNIIALSSHQIIGYYVVQMCRTVPLFSFKSGIFLDRLISLTPQLIANLSSADVEPSFS